MSDTKTILVTGATDGLGLATAKALVGKGHRVLLHERDPDKLKKVAASLVGATDSETYRADLSSPEAAEALAADVAGRHGRLDVVINNAGVYNVRETRSARARRALRGRHRRPLPADAPSAAAHGVDGTRREPVCRRRPEGAAIRRGRMIADRRQSGATQIAHALGSPNASMVA